jgi:cytosine/adenosine deaminase-related metal-dependent hydrolase
VIIRGNQRPLPAIRPVGVARVRMCGSGKPTDKDLDVVQQFARELARKAAVEKSIARYFELTCGHYGTREVDEVMREWRVKRLEHYCETCNGWKLSKQNYTKGNELPDTPLF